MLYGTAACYLILLLVILFRTVHPVRSLNLVPFHSIFEYLAGDNQLLHSFALINLAGNIVIFVPLGVYLTMFGGSKSIGKNLLYVLGFSSLVEIIQYTFKLGIGDIDDIILNCLGGLLGILLYKILLKLWGSDEKARWVVAVAAPLVGVVSFLLLYLYNM